MDDRKPKFFYGWFVVLATFCIQLVAFGTFNAFGILFNPWLDEFGWTREMISSSRSLAFLMMGTTGISAGRLGDRFGPRWVVLVCGSLVGLGYMLLSQVNTIWHLYLFYGVIVGIGVGGADILTLSTVAKRFIKKRGMATGFTKLGTGLGMVVVPLLASWLISGCGWRDACLVLGSVVLVVVVPAALFLGRDPGRKGGVAYGEEGLNTGSLSASAAGFSLQEAIHTRQFWLVCIIYFAINFCAQTILVHIAPHTLDLGFSAASAASVLATVGGMSMVGRVVMGIASDRVGNRLATVICFIILVVSLCWVQLARELWMLYLFVIVYGFAHGGFFVITSPLVAELFGLKAHGTIFSVAYFSSTIGGAIGPLLAGRIFDVTNSYQLVFLICATVGFVALLLSILLKTNLVKGLSR
jgi:MFS family permease